VNKDYQICMADKSVLSVAVGVAIDQEYGATFKCSKALLNQARNGNQSLACDAVRTLKIGGYYSDCSASR